MEDNQDVSLTITAEGIRLNYQLNINFHFNGQTCEVAMSRERLPLIGSYRSKATGETFRHLSKSNIVRDFKQISLCLMFKLFVFS